MRRLGPCGEVPRESGEARGGAAAHLPHLLHPIDRFEVHLKGVHVDTFLPLHIDRRQIFSRHFSSSFRMRLHRDYLSASAASTCIARSAAAGRSNLSPICARKLRLLQPEGLARTEGRKFHTTRCRAPKYIEMSQEKKKPVTITDPFWCAR